MRRLEVSCAVGLIYMSLGAKGLSILCVSEAVLPSLKQNLMQIRCSFTSVILAGRHDRKTALIRHKNAQKKKPIRPHSRTPLGRVVNKGYSSRYLAAHNCSTSGLRAAFQFQELLGSTTYIPSVFVSIESNSSFSLSLYLGNHS